MTGLTLWRQFLLVCRKCILSFGGDWIVKLCPLPLPIPLNTLSLLSANSFLRELSRKWLRGPSSCYVSPSYLYPNIDYSIYCCVPGKWGLWETNLSRTHGDVVPIADWLKHTLPIRKWAPGPLCCQYVSCLFCLFLNIDCSIYIVVRRANGGLMETHTQSTTSLFASLFYPLNGQPNGSPRRAIMDRFSQCKS